MKSNKVALSGILLGLNMIILFGATILPGIELTLFAVSSFMTGIVVLKTSPKFGLVFFAASSLLGVLILPNKLAILPYIIFFGYYPVAKYYIEAVHTKKLKDKSRQVFEIIIKVIIFSLSFGSGFFLFKEALFSGITLPDYPAFIILPAAIIGFLAYDYVFTLFIAYISKTLKI